MTEIDLYALRQMPELRAAEYLIALSLSELRYIGQLKGLKLKKGADKTDLVAAVLDWSHPRKSLVAGGELVLEQSPLFPSS